MSQRYLKPLWWIKLTKFEYWNWLAFYGPIIPAWLYLSLKARSLTFFTAVNPACTDGGFLKENKIEVLNLLPQKYLPFTAHITPNSDLPEGLKFPLVAKPNSGQRGNGVKKLDHFDELQAYHEQAKESYVLQEFIVDTVELAIFYSKLPGQSQGYISSITGKEFMNVTGDGVASIRQLMAGNDRFRFQLDTIANRSKYDLDYIPQAGELVVLEPIGNHCRGTKFVNFSHLISPELTAVFDEIMKGIDGFFYGRFDLKVKSLEHLAKGETIKIMELNGVNSDPAHIFDPNYTLLKAYKDVYWHWRRMAQIAYLNQSNGVKPIPVSQVWRTLQKKLF